MGLGVKCEGFWNGKNVGGGGSVLLSGTGPTGLSGIGGTGFDTLEVVPVVPVEADFEGFTGIFTDLLFEPPEERDGGADRVVLVDEVLFLSLVVGIGEHC